VPTGDASKLAHILWIIARIFEGATFEQRIIALEKLLQEGQRNND